jgi:primosomal protein N' (replication factor Y)
MQDSVDQFYEISVAAPLSYNLTYTSATELARGQSVEVSIGRRRITGVVVGPGQPSPEFKIKAIESLIEDRPRLHEAFLKWLEWLSNYYIYPLGQVVDLAFPPLKKSDKVRKSKKRRTVPDMARTEKPVLMPEQELCFANINAHKGFAAHLLYGVTGSGKTEVYLRLIEEVMARGEQALVLVPEISLTPQLIERFAQRFGEEKISVIHSHLTEREKTTHWWEMVEEKKSILIGARSALFCPVPKLGLVIVDEEHEPSFKQEEMLKYHARDAAVMLARFSNCPIVLGSATPSLETFRNATQGKYHLHKMILRVHNRPLPRVDVVEIRDERRERGGESSLPFWLSQNLFDKITQTIEKKEQVALFLNRRGVAQTVLCPSCGAIGECPNCSVSLTLHGSSHLLCHYCAYEERLKTSCGECRDGEPRPLGLGTELVEADIRKLFPEARLARADRDQIQSREEVEDLVKAMDNREIDILVGTQMIAKGWDFPGLTLVGMVLADVGFNLPDFRASERSFQLLTQVSGRSGRHTTSGEVVIQTYNPAHSSITFTEQNDYFGFAEHELRIREELNYPPFGKLACFRIQSTDPVVAVQTAQQLVHRARALSQQRETYRSIQLLGPAPAPIAKLRGHFRYHILMKAASSSLLNNYARLIVGNEDWIPPKARIIVDIDPMQML